MNSWPWVGQMKCSQVGQIKLPNRLHLKTVKFTMDGREYEAIEQNATKPSRWGELARAGHQVVQFKDVTANRFVAVSVDGEITEYAQMGRRDGR